MMRALLILLCATVAQAQRIPSGPRPAFVVEWQSSATAIATNEPGIPFDSCGTVGGNDWITISNHWTVSAPGWTEAARSVEDGRLLLTFTNAAGVVSRAVEDDRQPLYTTNAVFTGSRDYVAGTLIHKLWTNYVARTNAGFDSIQLYSGTIQRPVGGDLVATWRTNSVAYGMPGWSALSQFTQKTNGTWDSIGQVPHTLLTRRHVYYRGHGAGAPDVVSDRRAGMKIWFIGTNGEPVSASVALVLTRADPNGGVGNYTNDVNGLPVSTGLYAGHYNLDHSIAIMSNDLPDTVEHTMVVGADVWGKLPAGSCETTYRAFWDAPESDPGLLPFPFFIVNQHQRVWPFVWPHLPEFWTQWYMPGDSGSPAWVPHPEGLLWVGGISCGGTASTGSYSNSAVQIQRDIDTLTLALGLATNDYQLTYFDLSGYPDL
jgi:hypothetical protein